ncbi:T9SS type A sorting domain-containing protein [Flavivirga abyssicola]|uniref:T9SS type A sorting domain-containing protein n=1 Tax=Flavivirga abyssicola TaxID=3063533 RepID=UPI0026E047AC|nr:T9SS type A sorting domain-containing protein [Flavivirga sp. MEBiC07777]WVK14302.1 T9SS type A sorting domain-containing protein [Flavivirga sp. MEBiC07777]
MICKTTQRKSIKISSFLSSLLILVFFMSTSMINAQEPGAPTGLAYTGGTPNQFTLTWDADALATGGFNIGIVGADGSDIWIEWGYTTGTSYVFSGTYGAGGPAEITITDGQTYKVKLQAQPDTDFNAYSDLDVTVNGTPPMDPEAPTGLATTAITSNQFTLTWDADALATGGFNIGIVGADGSDIWIEWGYTTGTSYLFSGTYGSGTPAEITIADGGTYTVKLQAQPDSNFNAYSETTTGTLSANDINEVNFSVSPNPVANVVNIQANANTLNEILKISIYSLTGQLVKESNTVEIEVEDLSSGIYMLSVQDENGNTTTKKFVKN